MLESLARNFDGEEMQALFRTKAGREVAGRLLLRFLSFY